MNLRESIRRILNEELYSPAGKKYKPGRFVFHKSNPVWRENIELTGLQTSVGECYKIYSSNFTEEECKPAIFATDSENEEEWFDSTYDDDIWLIDTEIAGVTWYKDRHFDKMKHPELGKNKHIVTFQDIKPEALKLVYKGTGKSEDNIQESIKRILREENKIPINIRRRLREVEKMVDVVLSSSYPCDFENEDHYLEGVLYDLEAFLITSEMERMAEDVLSFVRDYFYDSIKQYYINSQKDC